MSSSAGHAEKNWSARTARLRSPITKPWSRAKAWRQASGWNVTTAVTKKTVPKRCPKCESEFLYFLGAGSQQGEERLQEIFPGARIGRMDRDTVRGRSDMERLLVRLHSGEINLLVGTQMIAKGHDVHGVTLVGVVGCDHALSMPDFRAAERVFQLMTQVSGRAARRALPGRVVVQTYHPDHSAILAASTHDYGAFVARELKYR